MRGLAPTIQESHQSSEEVPNDIWPEERSIPSTNMIRKWSKAFEKTGSITKAHKRKTTVDQEKIIQDFQENPKQSLRRASHKLGVSVSSVRNTLKKAGFKRYRPRIVQAL